MDGAIMSNHGAAAIEIGTVIAILAGMAIAKQRMPVAQPLSREQPLLSAAESQRLAIVSRSTDTFFRTGAIDRRGRTSTDGTIRGE
jgi:hypothetical protein